MGCADPGTQSRNVCVHEISTLTPTAKSWAQIKDREILCLIGQAEGTLTTGTAKGTAK